MNVAQSMLETKLVLAFLCVVHLPVSLESFFLICSVLEQIQNFPTCASATPSSSSDPSLAPPPCDYVHTDRLSRPQLPPSGSSRLLLMGFFSTTHPAQVRPFLPPLLPAERSKTRHPYPSRRFGRRRRKGPPPRFRPLLAGCSSG